LAIISFKKRAGDVKLNYEEGSPKQRELLFTQPVAEIQYCRPQDGVECESLWSFQERLAKFTEEIPASVIK